jgi:hypothetical protein
MGFKKKARYEPTSPRWRNAPRGRYGGAGWLHRSSNRRESFPAALIQGRASCRVCSERAAEKFAGFRNKKRRFVSPIFGVAKKTKAVTARHKDCQVQDRRVEPGGHPSGFFRITGLRVCAGDARAISPQFDATVPMSSPEAAAARRSSRPAIKWPRVATLSWNTGLSAVKAALAGAK